MLIFSIFSHFSSRTKLQYGDIARRITLHNDNESLPACP